jgi:superfamily I DNA/RNA helicase
LARAVYLAKNNPDWKILIVTYNKRLSKNLENYIADLNLTNNNIEIKNFHSLAYSFASRNVKNGFKDDNYWATTLPQSALENALLKKPIYDAILVDEYQDFYDLWLKFLIAILKTHNYKGREFKNIFLAGDRLQSIYNPKDINWRQSIGLDMRGRSKLLKKSYRVTKEHINLGLSILKQDKELAKEVEKFYEIKDGQENIELVNQKYNSIEYIHKSAFYLPTIIQKLLETYDESDILVLFPFNKQIQMFASTLEDKLGIIPITNNNDYGDSIIFSTYHSSKGIEKKVVILVDADKIGSENSKIEEPHKLIYVGTTRASEKLILLGENFSKNPIFKSL